MVVLALILLSFGIVLWVIAGIFFYYGRDSAKKTELMRATQTSTAAEVSDAAPGTLVEVEGVLRCESPLKSEMAGRTCAYFLSEVIREYEETEREADGDLETTRRSQVVSRSARFAPFAVEDESGAVGVRGEGAEVDALNVTNRYESDPGSLGSITQGGFTGGLGGDSGRTIGYRYVEGILPVDAPVYVLGAVQEDGRIGAPREGEGRFLISHRSEERLGKGLEEDARWMGWGALGLFLLGAVFVAAAVAIFVF
jgi:hypothetical protein